VRDFSETYEFHEDMRGTASKRIPFFCENIIKQPVMTVQGHTARFAAEEEQAMSMPKEDVFEEMKGA